MGNPFSRGRYTHRIKPGHRYNVNTRRRNLAVRIDNVCNDGNITWQQRLWFKYYLNDLEALFRCYKRTETKEEHFARIARIIRYEWRATGDDDDTMKIVRLLSRYHSIRPKEYSVSSIYHMSEHIRDDDAIDWVIVEETCSVRNSAKEAHRADTQRKEENDIGRRIRSVSTQSTTLSSGTTSNEEEKDEETPPPMIPAMDPTEMDLNTMNSLSVVDHVNKETVVKVCKISGRFLKIVEPANGWIQAIDQHGKLLAKRLGNLEAARSAYVSTTKEPLAEEKEDENDADWEDADSASGAELSIHDLAEPAQASRYSIHDPSSHPLDILKTQVQKIFNVGRRGSIDSNTEDPVLVDPGEGYETRLNHGPLLGRFFEGNVTGRSEKQPSMHVDSEDMMWDKRQHSASHESVPMAHKESVAAKSDMIDRVDTLDGIPQPQVLSDAEIATSGFNNTMRTTSSKPFLPDSPPQMRMINSGAHGEFNRPVRKMEAEVHDSDDDENGPQLDMKSVRSDGHFTRPGGIGDLSLQNISVNVNPVREKSVSPTASPREGRPNSRQSPYASLGLDKTSMPLVHRPGSIVQVETSLLAQVGSSTHVTEAYARRHRVIYGEIMGLYDEHDENEPIPMARMYMWPQIDEHTWDDPCVCEVPTSIIRPLDFDLKRNESDYRSLWEQNSQVQVYSWKHKQWLDAEIRRFEKDHAGIELLKAFAFVEIDDTPQCFSFSWQRNAEGFRPRCANKLLV